MNGSSSQIISGSGTWTTIGSASGLTALTIANTSGSNPAVDLQTNLTLGSTLNLTTGIFGSSTSNTLTLGLAATPFTTNRVTASSLTAPASYGYTTGVYTLNYSGGTTVTTGNELPSTSTAATNGVLAVTGASTNIQLSNNASIAQLSMTSGASTFNVNGFTLSIGGNATPINNTAGTLTADYTDNSASTIILTGSVAQTAITPGTYTGSNIANLTIGYSSAITGTLTAALNVTNFNISTSTSTFSIAALAFKVAGTYSNSGTITANTASSSLTLNGAGAQTFTVGTYTGSVINNLIINNTGSGVTLGAPVNATTLTLTNGLLITSSSNLMTVTGTAAMTTGSSTAYVQVRWL